MTMRSPDFTLYLVTDNRTGPELEHIVESAVAGGVRLVQWRNTELNARRALDELRALHALTRCLDVPLIINDRVDLAVAVGAEGVHLGQSDLPPDVARKLLGPAAIIGLSITAPEQLSVEAWRTADYLGAGPVFPTASKADAAPAIGIDGLGRICRSADIPVVAIGGILPKHLPEVRAAGCAGVAVISGICSAADPEEAARRYREHWEGTQIASSS